MGRITTDIRTLKKELRQKYRQLRENMDPAEQAVQDEGILKRILAFEPYQRAKTLLCFVSTGIEVDTRRLLQDAWQSGKRVAVPKCLDKAGRMDFFIVHSMEELLPSFYGLLEPDENKAERLVDYTASICILPGFAFDSMGYRIGFGKGYYDRFLQKYSGIKVGICYNSCMAGKLPHGRYDAAADYVITRKYTLTIQKQPLRGEYDE